MSKTKIEWTDDSSNNVTGCTHKSPGCQNCYAEVMSNRLKAMGNPKYANGFKLTLHPEVINEPLTWKKPRMIFMNSMSDTFHEDVPTYYICDVFDMMRRASQHVFQVPTKRAERLLKLSSSLPWPKNIWMGVSVESSDYIYRIDLLRKTPAHIKFLSIEPLLGPHRLSKMNISLPTLLMISRFRIPKMNMRRNRAHLYGKRGIFLKK